MAVGSTEIKREGQGPVRSETKREMVGSFSGSVNIQVKGRGRAIDGMIRNKHGFSWVNDLWSNCGGGFGHAKQKKT